MKRKNCLSSICIVFFLVGCVPGIRLKTEPASPAEVTGDYNLILYGAKYNDDLETVAFLEDAEGEYTFEPYAPDFDFSVVEDVPAKEALAWSTMFVSWHPDFWRTQFSRILDPENRTIGYEVRPLYYPLVYGIVDVLDVDYWLKPDGTVKITISLKQQIDRMLHEGGGRADGGGK
jgi:hypothetical protein